MNHFRFLFTVPGVVFFLLICTGLSLLIGTLFIFLLHVLLETFMLHMGYATLTLFLLGALPAFGIMYSIFSFVAALLSPLVQEKSFIPGFSVDLTSYPILQTLIQDVSKEMHKETPSTLILHPMSSIFVASGAFAFFNGTRKGTICCIGYPLLTSCTRDELRALLIREFARMAEQKRNRSTSNTLVKQIAVTYSSYLFTASRRKLGLILFPLRLPIILMKSYNRQLNHIQSEMLQKANVAADSFLKNFIGEDSAREVENKIVHLRQAVDANIKEKLTNQLAHGLVTDENLYTLYFDQTSATANNSSSILKRSDHLERALSKQYIAVSAR
ncbi:hypothetical protein [Bacillus sp. AFS002410]|uniref:hypothetical protein n=1 Tax=Bacillus sp. AFS002410 TaxID=2033481 RepID=UPI001155E941|nr:hypothetical protein [Bacillus sp. AFS002410]